MKCLEWWWQTQIRHGSRAPARWRSLDAQLWQRIARFRWRTCWRGTSCSRLFDASIRQVRTILLSYENHDGKKIFCQRLRCWLTIAGWDFCLTFVHCPNFVPFLSYFCLTFVPFLSPVPLLSWSCLSILSFVLIWTSFCPHWSQKCPTFVLIWSPESMKNGEDRYWTKLRLNHFSTFLPGHPAAGQKVDNVRTPVPNLSSICPSTYSSHNYLYFTVI